MYSILIAAGWPIWPLLAISILGLAILIERSWYLRKKHIVRKESIEEAFGASTEMAKNVEFLAHLSASSPIGNLLAGVLREHALGHSAEAAMEELQILAQNLWTKLDRYLGALATIATVAPLLLFNGAATRLPLSTLGLLQYTTPTMMFLIGVFINREDITKFTALNGNVDPDKFTQFIKIAQDKSQVSFFLLFKS